MVTIFELFNLYIHLLCIKKIFFKLLIYIIFLKIHIYLLINELIRIIEEKKMGGKIKKNLFNYLNLFVFNFQSKNFINLIIVLK